MKKIFLILAFILLLTGCKSVKEAELLHELGAEKEVSKEELKSEDFVSFLNQLDLFSSDITESLCDSSNENVCISPLSIFMALSLGVVCSEGNELSNYLGVDRDALDRNIALLYNVVTKRRDENKVLLSNSIWLDKQADYQQNVVKELAMNYYASSYQVDFKNQNKQANLQIEQYLKDNTMGLIDQNLNMDPTTLVALINTLYFKDNWGSRDLSFTKENYEFLNENGNKKNLKLMEGKYIIGRAKEEDNYSHFYTTTGGGYRLSFVVPKAGYTLNDIFTKETILHVSNYVYDRPINQYTRCVFPSFEVDYKENISDVLNLGDINFNRLFKEDVSLGKIVHVTKLKVNEEGIEGAAATILEAPTSPGPDENKMEYFNFVVDRGFGYILMDSNGIPLFTGTIRNL